MSSVVADLRFAVRLMTRGPGLTVILVLTLALGIATSTAIFSVVNSVLIKPLPYKDPEQLVRVYTEFRADKMQLPKFWVSAPEYFDLARACRSCAETGMWTRGTGSIAGGDRPVRVDAAYATASLLPMIGVKPALGRWFDAGEDAPGGDFTVAVLGYNVWQRAFGGSPDVIGKHVTIDATPVTIIGVMPKGFTFLSTEEIWIPLKADPADVSHRGGHNFEVVIRLKPDASFAAFQSELDALMAAWSAGRHREDNGPHFIHKDGHPMIAFPLHDDVVGGMASALWMLQGAALFVLLIAIVNIANLLLTRSETRSREIAVRHALGARRRRLIRQFVTESLAMGVIGGGLGVLGAVWALDGIVALIPQSAPRIHEIRLDATAVLFAVACTVGASVLFGLAPILHARRTDIHTALKDGSPRMTGSKARQRVRRGLVIAEVALAVVLVVGCAVMVKSFIRLQRVDLGMKPDHMLTAEIEIPAKVYTDAASGNQFWQRLEDKLVALPGVVDATLVGGLPPTRRLMANDIEFPGRAHTPDDAPWNVDYWNIIGDRTIETLGMRLVRGRALGPSDTAGTPNVVMINQRFADRFWPGEDPIGKVVNIAGWNDKGTPQTVVGVVADVKQMGIDRPAGTEVFLTAWQYPQIVGDDHAHLILDLAIRTHGAPGDLAPALDKAVHAIDPTLPVSKLRTMDDVMWEAVARPRFLTFLLSAFAIMALLLAGVGIYGVMAHTVEQRTHEIGLRVALGAQPRQVRWMVLRQAGSLAVIGAAAGVAVVAALQLALGAKMKTVLYGAALADPLVLGGVAVVVLGAALLATWIPARRATTVEPMVALRTE